MHDEHLPKLKGFSKRYNTLANGACLENSVALHILKNEKEGENVKRKINNHIADNWDFYEPIVNLPYKETIGVGEHSKKVEKKTKEEMLNFLRDDESLLAFSNIQEIIAVSKFLT